MRAKQDGQPIGPKQTITAEEQRRRLGLDKPGPKPAELRPTPAQARREMSGEWRGEDLDPPDFERSVVSDADAIANALGMRPEDFDTPLGSMPEGVPVPLPAVRPNIEPREADEAPRPPREVDAATAAELRADYQAHAAKIREIAARAKASGDPVREANAAEEVRRSAEVGEALKARGVL